MYRTLNELRKTKSGEIRYIGYKKGNETMMIDQVISRWFKSLNGTKKKPIILLNVNVNNATYEQKINFGELEMVMLYSDQNIIQ